MSDSLLKSPVPRIINLGSGSKGNSSVICLGEKILMVDCGFNRKQTLLRMAEMGLNPDQVCGILVTHEHGDHMQGARLCSQKMDAPILATAGTISGGNMSALNHQILRRGEIIAHHGFEITTLKISHDTKEPCAFLVEAAGVRTLFATDVGTVEGLDLRPMKDLDYLYVESNHDEVMLRTGPYPAFLKNRIIGDGGHLNNHQSGLLIRSLAAQSPQLKSIMLAHLSHENNDPEKALVTTRECAGELPGVIWDVARQHEPREMAG